MAALAVTGFGHTLAANPDFALDPAAQTNGGGSSPNVLALVGHEPDLSQWAELLIWGEAKGVLQLKKAGIIGIEIPDHIDPIGNSILFWLTPPRLLLLS